MADKPETTRGELLPVLPLRDIVVFPAHDRAAVRRPGEIRPRAGRGDARRQADPAGRPEECRAGRSRRPTTCIEVGTVSTVLQLLKLPDGTVKVLVEGGRRAKIAGFKETQSHFEAYASALEEPDGTRRSRGAGRTVVGQFEQYIKLNKKIAPEVLVSINQIDDPNKLADTVAAHLSLKIPEKQELLETAGTAARLERVFAHMEGEIGVLQVEKRIRNRVKRQMEKTQREYYLNEQLKAIQKELGEGEDGKDEAAELEAKHQDDQAVQGSAREGDGRAEEAPHHVADVGRSDGGAQLPRLDAVIPWKKRSKVKQRHRRGREGAR